MKTFLLCDSAEHADVVDQFIMESLRDRDNAQGSSWSEVYTNGTLFGVLWASPASELFGNPEDDPAIVLFVDTDDDWSLLDLTLDTPVDPLP